MAGLDRRTGSHLTNFQSAKQGVQFILVTRIASVPLLREFGGGVVELLGRATTPSLFAAWKLLVATAIDLWEPRFRVRRVVVSGSIEELRRGEAKLKIEADWRPRYLLGDDTVERQVDLLIGFQQGVTIE